MSLQMTHSLIALLMFALNQIDTLCWYSLLSNLLRFLKVPKISQRSVPIHRRSYKPASIVVDVMTALAFTVSIECWKGFARRLVLIKAVMQPILLNPIQTQGYSSEFSNIRAMTSPRVYPSAAKKFANWLVRSSTLKEEYSSIVQLVRFDKDLLYFLKWKRCIIENKTRFRSISLHVLAKNGNEITFEQRIVFNQYTMLDQSVETT